MNTFQGSRLPSRFYTRKEVAELLLLSSGTLANWASRRTGPPYFRLEDGHVIYSEDQLLQWLDTQRQDARVA
ncbi:helix-turn-helix domain-containing protein [Arthrobacter gengyunqii]|uniref:helix-turn-helix domain-containing protein n=1 Tax=Arthrobacter gengyunqii TaxID=2886940 RepID=UPI003C2ED87D